jgi:hypothetical protein
VTNRRVVMKKTQQPKLIGLGLFLFVAIIPLFFWSVYEASTQPPEHRGPQFISHFWWAVFSAVFGILFIQEGFRPPWRQRRKNRKQHIGDNPQLEPKEENKRKIPLGALLISVVHSGILLWSINKGIKNVGDLVTVKNKDLSSMPIIVVLTYSWWIMEIIMVLWVWITSHTDSFSIGHGHAKSMKRPKYIPPAEGPQLPTKRRVSLQKKETPEQKKRAAAVRRNRGQYM